MENLPYTLATYRVRPGKEDEFIKRWHSLADIFQSLKNPPYWGTLIRSETTANLFHSFGPWESREHVAAMRASPEAGAAFQAIQELCEQMTPDNYRVVVHIRVRTGGDP